MSGKEDSPSGSAKPREQGNISLQCPKLTESNYTTWALLMETILKAYGLWEAVSSEEEVDEKKAYTTKAMILQTLPEDILMQVAQHPTAKEVWDAIKVRHLGADLVQKARLQTLRSELETLKMKENETVSDFSEKLGSIRAKFKSFGSNLKDKILVRKLLNLVPKKFLPIVASIEQYLEIDKMPFEEAVGRIIAFEERLKSKDEPEDDNERKLLMASNHPKNWRRGRGRDNTSQDKDQGREPFKEERKHGNVSRRNKDKSNLKCYECNEYGHFAYECPKWRNKEREKDLEAHLIHSLTTLL
ncbi:uncharacterized protein LOC143560703 [Bidens hawaiensis]|uniref:uncharacterized protein LOC143560703 n=1 Tax=Bidens hawaiensis TaxID=980011 RepID=UPI00404962FD